MQKENEGKNIIDIYKKGNEKRIKIEEGSRNEEKYENKRK
jgi:hypothetical protein